MVLNNEEPELKYINRTGTARSSFSAVSTSRHLSVSPNLTKRIKSAPIDRQTESFYSENLKVYDPPNICTISGSIENSTNQLYPLPQHITPTHYRPETAKSTRSSILVYSEN